MGFLDWLFGKKKEEEKFEEKEFSIESGKEILQRKIDEETKRFWPKIGDFNRELRGRGEQLEAALEKFREASPPEKIDEQLLKIANTSRRTFAAKMSSLTAAIKREFSSNINSFYDYYKTIAATISQINQETVKEFASIHVAYEKETNDVVDRMKDVKKIIDDFRDELKNETKKADALEKILGDVRVYEEKISKKDERLEANEKLKKGIENLEKEKAALETQLQELGQGDVWKTYIELTRQKEAKEAEVRKIIEEVVNIFASISRVLKRFVKMTEDGSVEFKSKDLLKTYVESPFDAFVQDENLSTINLAIGTLIEALENQKITFDDGGESMRILKELKSNEILKSLSARYSESTKIIGRLKEQIENHDFIRKRKELQENISKLSRDIEENKKSLEQQQKQENELGLEISEMKKSLETELKGI